jgi:hypothetical protein
VFIRILVTILVSITLLGQTRNEPKKGERPVFMSAERLASMCQDWAAVRFPNGHPLAEGDTVTVSHEQIIHAVGCEMYIQGVMDEGLETTLGSHYHPVQSEIGGMKASIDTFLKYVKDHPEQHDFAASTILDESEKVLSKAQSK